MEVEGRKPRLIYSWPYLSWGGAQVFFLNLAKALTDSFEITFILPSASSRGLIEQLEETGCRVILFPGNVELGPATGILAKIQRHFVKLVGEARYVRFITRRTPTKSVLHVELAPWQSMLSLIAFSLRGPVFSTIHNRIPPASGYRRFIWKLKFHVLSCFGGVRFFAANLDAKRSLEGLAPRKFLDKTTILYANVDVDRIGDLRKERQIDHDRLGQILGIEAGSRVIVTTGQFIERKGRSVLAETAKHFEQNGDGIVFLWLTDTALDREGEILSGGNGSIRIVRPEEVGIGRDAPIRFLGVGDLFVLPSLFEGLPISLLEAMAYGIPCVTTRINGIPEAVSDGVEGSLVTPGDSRALIDKIESLLSETETASLMAQNAIRKVAACFSSRQVAQVALGEYLKGSKSIDV
jgi:glycosyltransferase involved in cell wall biosynthesis